MKAVILARVSIGEREEGDCQEFCVRGRFSSLADEPLSQGKKARVFNALAVRSDGRSAWL